jgi:alpha-L-glutamate ligase-like protein
MVKSGNILGLNARDQVYCSQNTYAGKKFGFSKYRTKEFLAKHGLQVAKLYAILKSSDDVRNFDWNETHSSFVIKPSNGSAGKGVLVIKRRDKQHGFWVDVEGHHHSADDLRFHSNNILDGQYSTWGTAPNVIVEERVPIHPDLEAYVSIGTPDVRVIVYNKIPAMAMVRLPTKESGGRANLDQGAIALGIDMGTGKTLFGVSGKKDLMKEFPGTQVNTQGIQIPFWTDVLATAVRAANATNLRYMGADIFLHPERGPMVAEVNAFPGLSIQLANRAGLRGRLQQLEEIKARHVSHAVKIAQSLFAENYPLENEGEATIIATKEPVEVYGDDGRSMSGMALVNTAREWSAISYDAAEVLGLADTSDVLWTQYVEGAGKEVVVEVKYKLHGKVKTTTMVVSKRLSSTKHLMHLGRKDLKGYIVDPNRTE